ncbi:hypothetical protein LTR78_006639 [Recurvomyces mirabilis]|uniref:C2H2-type domain-containing protein n=1 Tax=Recurvomyces mirabilis TaxID=574656 RepID=A0AAE0WKI5_9PEZI|nr:hypothetical protein LTR78_006639 [Recurvomyces mirabilis]KAK5151470.1 hypothetical protein LTS14_009314 [Recurvomyces mirabilis]
MPSLTLAGEQESGTTKLKGSATSLSGCSRSLSHFPAPPTTLSTSALANSSSPHVTLRVLALVKGICRRFAKRAPSERTRKVQGRKTIGKDFCPDLESQAYAEIDKYLGKKVVYPHLRKTKIDDRRSQGVESILDLLDNAIHDQGNGLIAVAKDHSGFLDRRTEFKVSKLSLQELVALFVGVKQLFSQLSERSLVKGDEVLVPDLDDLSLANLEHLLLCLLHVLLRALASEALGQPHQHLLDCQKDRSVHSEEWFFEYPNAQHPLSTTWPWSLRPSLAVLWGVCWMFYDRPVHLDNEGNLRNDLGEEVVPADIVRLHQGLTQFRQTPAATGNQTSRPERQTQNMLAMSQQPGRSLMPDRPGFHHYSPRSSYPHDSTQNHHTTRPNRDSTLLPTAAATSRRNRQRSQNTDARGYRSQNTNTIGTAASNSPDAAWLDSGAAGIWQPDGLPQSHNPPSRHFITSAIRPYAHPGQPSQQSQSQSYVGFGLPQDNNPIWEGTSNSYLSHLYPPTSQAFPNMAEVATPMVSASTHQITSHRGDHSPHDPNQHQGMHDPALMGRKRSHDEMMNQNMDQADSHQNTMQMLRNEMESQNAVYPEPPDHADYPQPALQGRTSEQDRNAQDSGQDEDQSDSPQRARTIRRGDPPKNAEGQMICTYADGCAAEIFDRKCEWGKHMDKHDRPYKCGDPDCAKMQGFTYSGGLLRHEREVHHKHGGPKATLRCPVAECKRHLGKGFTRKENLNEHVRRVHDGKVPEAPQPTTLQDELENALAGAEQGADQTTDPQLPTSMPFPDPSSEHYQVETAQMAKRQRTDDGSDDSSELEQLQLQNARLRAENAVQGDRIREMETREAIREARLAQLELFFGGMQQPIPDQQEDQEGAGGKVDAGMA